MGEIRISKTKQIDVSADLLWKILAEDFEKVGGWATGVSTSGPNHGARKAFDDAPGGGRICDVPGFGETDEQFTNYDAGKMTFAYSVDAAKAPSFMKGLENTWSVSALGDGRSQVMSQIEANATGMMGAMMGPMMKKKLSSTIDKVLEDLTVYAETGNISQSKKRALAKHS